MATMPMLANRDLDNSNLRSEPLLLPLGFGRLRGTLCANSVPTSRAEKVRRMLGDRQEIVGRRH
jgi:hypothetical protein